MLLLEIDLDLYSMISVSAWPFWISETPFFHFWADCKSSGDDELTVNILYTPTANDLISQLKINFSNWIHAASTLLHTKYKIDTTKQYDKKTKELSIYYNYKTAIYIGFESTLFETTCFKDFISGQIKFVQDNRSLGYGRFI